jgi:membrane-bound inhibitor of C-type lysozyme
MLLRSAAAAALLAVGVGGCDHHVEVAGPAGIPYACTDGKAARIFYDGGDPNRAPARLEHDGHSTILNAAPAINGLRYQSEAGLIWWAQGDDARLARAAADGTESEIARCTRVREGGAPAPREHGEDH